LITWYILLIDINANSTEYYKTQVGPSPRPSKQGDKAMVHYLKASIHRYKLAVYKVLRGIAKELKYFYPIISDRQNKK